MTHRKIVQFIFVVPIWLLLSLAAGMHWLGTSRDYDQYLQFYDSLSRDWPFHTSRFEPGFVALAWVSKNFLGFGFATFLTAVAAVSLGIKFILFTRRPYPWILIAAYVPSLYLLHELTQVRTALALAFAYLAVDLLFANKRWHAFVLMVIGASMHASTLLFMPLLAVSRSWIDRRFVLSPFTTALIILPAIGMYLLVSHLAFINPLVALYIGAASTETVTLFSVRNVGLLFLLVLGIVGYDAYSFESKVQVVIGLAGFGLFFTLIQVPVFAQRTVELSMMSYFLWVTRIPRLYAILAMGALLAICGYLGYRQIVIDPLFH